MGNWWECSLMIILIIIFIKLSLGLSRRSVQHITIQFKRLNLILFSGRIQEMIVVKDRPEIVAGILAKNFSQGYALLHSTVDMYLKNKDMYEHGENVFHKLSECVIPIQVAFKIIQFSLLRETINEMLLKFVQWGFFQVLTSII